MRTAALIIAEASRGRRPDPPGSCRDLSATARARSARRRAHADCSSGRLKPQYLGQSRPAAGWEQQRSILLRSTSIPYKSLSSRAIRLDTQSRIQTCSWLQRSSSTPRSRGNRRRRQYLGHARGHTLPGAGRRTAQRRLRFRGIAADGGHSRLRGPGRPFESHRRGRLGDDKRRPDAVLHCADVPIPGPRSCHRKERPSSAHALGGGMSPRIPRQPVGH